MSWQRNALLNDPDFARSAPGVSLLRDPLGFVDVGARGGVHELASPLAGATAVLGFEPEPEECARLRADVAAASPWARCDFEPVALGEHDGTAELHLLTAATNSSLRPPNAALTRRYAMVKWQVTGTLPLRTTTLDAVLFERRAREPFWGEMLKLDTQGTEYEILRGAARTLRERATAVVCEVSFCELYAGQRLFSEVELLLREQGFSFYGFLTFHHRSRKALDKRVEASRERALYADAAFLRDPLPGGPRAAGEPAPDDICPLGERRLHSLFAAALLLGFNEFALELALATWASGAEARRIEALVKRWSARPPRHALDDALELAARVCSRPDLANVEVGRFVDRRRELCDYDDVLLG
jgi:FkbM family methyltransferase